MYQAQNNLYSIQFVSNITGINPHTIRAWEKRYGATTPIRDKNGRRLYSDQEIQRLETLNKLVSVGNSISDIARMEKSQLDSVLEKYTKDKPETFFEKAPRKSVNIDQSLQSLLAAVRLKKADVLFTELKKCEDSFDSMEFIYSILIPMFYELGEVLKSDLLNDDEIESIKILLKSTALKKLNSKRLSTKVGKRKALIGSASNGINELGSFIAMAIFLDKGFDVEYIGSDISSKAILTINDLLSADIVFLAVDYCANNDNEIKKNKDLISKLVNSKSSSDIFIGALKSENNYKGFDIENINSFELLRSTLENT